MLSHSDVLDQFIAILLGADLGDPAVLECFFGEEGCAIYDNFITSITRATNSDQQDGDSCTTLSYFYFLNSNNCSAALKQLNVLLEYSNSGKFACFITLLRGTADLAEKSKRYFATNLLKIANQTFEPTGNSELVEQLGYIIATFTEYYQLIPSAGTNPADLIISDLAKLLVPTLSFCTDEHKVTIREYLSSLKQIENCDIRQAQLDLFLQAIEHEVTITTAERVKTFSLLAGQLLNERQALAKKLWLNPITMMFVVDKPADCNALYQCMQQMLILYVNLVKNLTLDELRKMHDEDRDALTLMLDDLRNQIFRYLNQHRPPQEKKAFRKLLSELRIDKHLNVHGKSKNQPVDIYISTCCGSYRLERIATACYQELIMKKADLSGDVDQNSKSSDQIQLVDQAAEFCNGVFGRLSNLRSLTTSTLYDGDDDDDDDAHVRQYFASVERFAPSCFTCLSLEKEVVMLDALRTEHSASESWLFKITETLSDALKSFLKTLGFCKPVLSTRGTIAHVQETLRTAFTAGA